MDIFSHCLKRVLSVATVLGIVVALLVSPAAASLTPSQVELELEPGESVTIEKTVDVPERPPTVDVVFAFDLTGSMGGTLSTAKSKSTSMMSQLNAIPGMDVQFGVVSYMDYTDTYTSHNYTATYGSAASGDYPYSMDQSVTDNTSSVSSAINGLTLGYGMDGPEAYTRMMYESYADSNISWRPGAKRIVVNFGDHVPHDDNLNDGITSDTWSTGADPGRDAVVLNADDLDLQTVLAGMDSNGVTLIEAHTSNWTTTSGLGVVQYWAHWTGITGGQTFLTGSSTLVTDVVNAVNATASTPTVHGLHLEAEAGYEDWVDFDPDEYGNVTTGTSVVFNETVTVPMNASPGVHSFNVTAMDEDGVVYGTQTVIVTVPDPVVEVDIDVKPGSDPNSINCGNENVAIAVAILTTDEFDATTVDHTTVVFENATETHVDRKTGEARRHVEDVDGDGDLDLVIHVRQGDTDLTCDSTEGMLTGETFGGDEVVGNDSVRMVQSGGNNAGPANTDGNKGNGKGKGRN